jgi:hypothetical protein
LRPETTSKAAVVVVVVVVVVVAARDPGAFEARVAHGDCRGVLPQQVIRPDARHSGVAANGRELDDHCFEYDRRQTAKS